MSPIPTASTVPDPFANIMLELALLLTMVVVARWLTSRMRQPAVLGELLIGVLVGNLGYWLGLPFFQAGCRHHPARLRLRAGPEVRLSTQVAGRRSLARTVKPAAGALRRFLSLTMKQPLHLAGWHLAMNAIGSAAP